MAGGGEDSCSLSMELQEECEDRSMFAVIVSPFALMRCKRLLK